MTEQPGPLPQRIGDAERDRATEYLRDHLAEGRLDQTEFDERLTKALTARTQADLEPLFSDLPGPKPGDAVVPASSFQAPPWQSVPSQAITPRPGTPTPVQAKANSFWVAASALAWPAAIIFCFATNWQFWWVMMIPIFFPWWLGQEQRRHGPHRRR